MRTLLWMVTFLLLAPLGTARAFDMHLEAHGGGGAFAGRGWGANRPAEALAGSLSLRPHAFYSLDARFIAQRLRYRSIEQVDTDGYSVLALAGAHAYPLLHRHRVEPRLGLFAGYVSTLARSEMGDAVVDLHVRSLAVGPSLGLQITFGRGYAAGFDTQVLRVFEQHACIETASRTMSCDALGHTNSYLATALLTMSFPLK